MELRIISRIGQNLLQMKLIKDLLFITFISGIIGLCNYILNPNRPNIELASDEITLEMLAKLPKPIMVIDARSSKEFAAGHVKNAYNISESEFDTHLSNFLDAWIPDSTLVVYCNPSTCNSSRSIANRLKNECGMKKVYVLKDDWKKWKN